MYVTVFCQNFLQKILFYILKEIISGLMKKFCSGEGLKHVMNEKYAIPSLPVWTRQADMQITMGSFCFLICQGWIIIFFVFICVLFMFELSVLHYSCRPEINYPSSP